MSTNGQYRLTAENAKDVSSLRARPRLGRDDDHNGDDFAINAKTRSSVSNGWTFIRYRVSDVGIY